MPRSQFSSRALIDYSSPEPSDAAALEAATRTAMTTGWPHLRREVPLRLPPRATTMARTTFTNRWAPAAAAPVALSQRILVRQDRSSNSGSRRHGRARPTAARRHRSSRLPTPLLLRTPRNSCCWIVFPRKCSVHAARSLAHQRIAHSRECKLMLLRGKAPLFPKLSTPSTQHKRALFSAI